MIYDSSAAGRLDQTSVNERVPEAFDAVDLLDNAGRFFRLFWWHKAYLQGLREVVEFAVQIGRKLGLDQFGSACGVNCFDPLVEQVFNAGPEVGQRAKKEYMPLLVVREIWVTSVPLSALSPVGGLD